MKKHGWKCLVSGVVLMALVMGLTVPAFAMTGKKQMEVDYMDIYLTVDGVPVGGLVDSNGKTVQPFACEGTTYLPVRAVGEALGKEVRWDGPTRTVYISDPAEPKAMTVYPYNGSSARKETIAVDYLDIKLVVDGKEVTPKDVNGKVVEPFAYNGTTYLPVRAVGEALGKTVRWDGETKTVHLGEMPQATYLVDVCKLAGNNSYFYRAADHNSFTMSDGMRYSQGFWAPNRTEYWDKRTVFELGGKYESLTFNMDAYGIDSESVRLEVYLDGELAQEIVVQNDESIETVTVPLNYAQTVAFCCWNDKGHNTVRIANAVLNGERTAPARPVPPANATYLVDTCTLEGGYAYKAAEGEGFADIFGNVYTNGIRPDSASKVALNGLYKTLRGTITYDERAITGVRKFYKSIIKFYIDGKLVKEITMSADTPPQAIEIPLSYGMELEIKTSDGKFFLADAILE